MAFGSVRSEPSSGAIWSGMPALSASAAPLGMLSAQNDTLCGPAAHVVEPDHVARLDRQLVGNVLVAAALEYHVDVVGRPAGGGGAPPRRRPEPPGRESPSSADPQPSARRRRRPPARRPAPPAWKSHASPICLQNYEWSENPVKLDFVNSFTKIQLPAAKGSGRELAACTHHRMITIEPDDCEPMPLEPD